MVNSQKGYTILEAIAYLAIYGAIAVAVLSGASFIMDEVREKEDLAAIVKLEQDIRSAGTVLNNFDVSKTNATIVGTETTLKGFLTNKAKIKNTDKLPSGKNVTFEKSGTITPINTCTAFVVAYSFAITIENLSLSECADYWNYPWPKTLVLMKADSTYNVSSTSCQIELKDPDFCAAGKNFTLYFK